MTAVNTRSDKALSGEERFQLLMKSVTDYAIILLDENGFITSWNEGAQRIKGYNEQEILGKHFSTFYPQHDIDSGKPADELKVAASTGRFEEEGWRLRKDGSRFFANVVISSIVDDAGKLCGFAKITRDITEKKEAEIRVKEFYSVLSHELRSPLTSIRGTLGLLEGGLVGDLSSDALEVTCNARSSCDRLIRLVNSLLDLSKLDANQFHLNTETLLPADLVNEVMESMGSVGVHKANIRVGILENVPFVGDRDRLVQVLTNLIANAVKFSPPGGVVIVEVQAKVDEVTFFVKDEGIGIPLTAGNKLFGKFYQIDGSDSRPQEGTGLGLAISKAIVEQHDGTIGYDSQLGCGATFWFSIPNMLGTISL